MKNLKRTKVTFDLQNHKGEIEKQEFVVYQNLPDTPGLSINDAIDNWSIRTKKYTAASLCNYIARKQTGYLCITEEQFNNANEPAK